MMTAKWISKKNLYWFMLLTCMTSLQGCLNVATTGAQMVYNKQSVKKIFADQYMSNKAYEALNFQTKEFKDANISIAAYNGEILLAGQVPKEWQKERAEQIIKTIPNVKEVHNLVTISSPSSTLTRISDAWITAKIKAKFIASDDLDVTQIKIVTENGIVYLMGILLPEEAQAAIDIASETDGVRKVVNVFSYMQITKHLA